MPEELDAGLVRRTFSPECDDGAETGPPVEQIRATTDEMRLAIYKEKYANFRHFDQLRWQVPGIAVAVGGALVAFGPRTSANVPPSWLLLICGVFLEICGFLMIRIRGNLTRNNAVLAEVAKQIGDHSIPGNPNWRGAAFWVETFLIGTGALAILGGLST